jgi:hypothetical protein
MEVSFSAGTCGLVWELLPGAAAAALSVSTAGACGVGAALWLGGTMAAAYCSRTSSTCCAERGSLWVVWGGGGHCYLAYWSSSLQH